jgi:hypothetical protein
VWPAEIRHAGNPDSSTSSHPIIILAVHPIARGQMHCMNYSANFEEIDDKKRMKVGISYDNKNGDRRTASMKAK